MFTEFQDRLLKKYDAIQQKKLLLAISGGVDSMVLFHLMLKNQMNISVAHCNFNLRGEDSFKDESFVVNYCEENQIPCFNTSFDTKKYASENKVSIQIAARELRYQWFFELKNKYQFDYIATAHHLDDSLETFFINLSRGTGIEGLTGIRETDSIIRPLLDFSRKEIEDYATENNVEWREDISNQSDKYLRNKIRHTIVPVFKELNPEFLTSFSRTIGYLQQIEAFVNEVSDEVLNKLIREVDNRKYLKIDALLRSKNYRFILYKWLSEYGFTAWKDIYKLIESQSGKFVETEDFRLLKDRNELILFKKEKLFSAEEYVILEDKIDYPIPIKLTEVEQILEKDNPNIIFVDKNLLNFPLVIRKYKEGEYFYPFGMQGKKKKISKFFKDEKLSVIDKENTWILYTDDQVVWVVGKRLDERFKITSNTTTILKVEYLL